MKKPLLTEIEPDFCNHGENICGTGGDLIDLVS
jgi:hypothetical protein